LSEKGGQYLKLRKKNFWEKIDLFWGIYNKVIEMKKVIRLTENDLVRLVKKIMNEQVDTSRHDARVNSLIQDGYSVVDKISLPDGEYDLTGAGYICYLNKDGKNTGYAYVTTGGIRGMWDKQKVRVVGGKIPNLMYGEVYKMLFNKSKVEN
jgi:hypothetical protein